MSARPDLKPLLVCFADFNGYTKHAASLDPVELFRLFSDYTKFANERVRGANGHLVKMIGDALLVVFPEEHASAGVMCLKALKDASETWMAQRGFKTRMVFKVHFGDAAFGPFGADGRLDVYGSTVNAAATLESRGFAISPQAFRQLGAEERKVFKKHTPPVTYIALEERH